jgi:hypothetical protein
MKPNYINFKEGTIYNKRIRPECSVSICQVEAPEPFFWIISTPYGVENYGYCLTIEQAEDKVFELIGDYEMYLDTHEEAEAFYNYLTNEELRRQEEERQRKELERHKAWQAKEKARLLFEEALRIAPGITREQYEAIIMAAREAGIFVPEDYHADLPF